MAALRQEMNALLRRTEAVRRPALRRTDRMDALLTTDLPLCAAPEAVDAFRREAEAAGWSVGRAGDWLTLDHPVPCPAVASAVQLPGEAGCCLSLLRRHPGDDAPGELVRALSKAGEAGRLPLERLCRELHGAWAQALRLGQPLPSGLIPYLIAAYEEAKGDDTP